jgi:hypothetical protein
VKLLFEIAAGWLVVVGFLGVLVVHSVLSTRKSRLEAALIAAFGAVTRSVLKRPRNNRQADADLQ